jgi:shikimate kinase
MAAKVGVLREYIQTHGWPAFRELEAKTLAEILASGPAVVDCGGGVVETPANVELMRRHGEIVWLRATVETMQARLRNSHRRMALGSATDDDKIRELLARREPLYTAAATLTFDTDGKTPETVAEEIATEVRL